MKKKTKLLTYLLSGFIPLFIFFICGLINKLVPFGEYYLNVYDSYTQYSGILLELKNLLFKGNLFYSWNGGLGFNFLGTLFYYCASPLNLFAIFANTENFPYFFAYITFARIFLLGISMCFYLTKRGTKPLYTVLFSVMYALMGYTATYYYNYIWIDSVIMLPLIIHGLDKLIDGEKPVFYIITLGITILINYYIGYMISIFIVLYFIYKLVNVKDKKTVIKKFIVSSLLAGAIGALSIMPSFFALMSGKASLYSNVNYGGFNRNITTFFYTLTSGEYIQGDQTYGPALVYTSIMGVTLSIFYFFNKSFTKKEKIVTLAILLFFYLSFSLNFLNYAWQFFQKPIWWQSRFSFVFSFFIITIALKTLENIDKTDFKLSYRIVISVIFIILCIVGLFFKAQVQKNMAVYTYVYLGFSLVLFLEEMFLIDKSYALPILILFTGLDISINTFNSLKQNNRGIEITHYSGLKRDLPDTINEINEINKDKFYRLELTDDYLSNDGMYFNYHGFNYFNSVRNIKVITLMKNLGIKSSDHCHIELDKFDPVFLSLFNFKYLYGKIDYFDFVDQGLYENPYPLSIGIVGSDKIKDVVIEPYKYKENLNNIISGILGEDITLYRSIKDSEFTLKNVVFDGEEYKLIKEESQGTISYDFTSDDVYMLMPNDQYVSIYVNGEDIRFDKSYILINKGDKVEITFRLYGKTEKEKIFVDLLYYNRYKEIMDVLSSELMDAYTYKNGHILEGYVDVSKDDSYLFTSIEYEKGMKVYVDNEKVDYDVILDTLIGIPLDKGSHTITIDYVPKGLIPGAIISFIGVIGTVIYLQFYKKHL